MNRPDIHEYNPYFQHYIDLVETGEFFAVFDRNTEQTELKRIKELQRVNGQSRKS